MNSTTEGAARMPWLKPAIIGLAAAAALAFAGRNALLGTPVEAHTAVRSDLVQTVVASGRIMTPRRVSVGATIAGRVLRIPVVEGQTVRREDVLIELDAKDERAAVVQAEANIAQADAKLRQLRELALPAAQQNLAQAQANLTQARQQYERTRALQAKGFVGQAQLDDAQRNLAVAESQLRAAELQVKTNSPAGSDYLLARAALAQAEAGLRVARARLEQTVIRATVDGTLIARNVEPGHAVQPGKELMVLAPAGEIQVWLNIDERNLSQLAVGQKALASADAYPHERFAAELVYINPGIDALRGSVEVRLRVPHPPAYLRQDMTVSADIEVARRSSTVVVPADALRDAGSTQPWVLAVRDRHTVRIPVKPGLRGEGRVEIIEGVAPGDLLVSSTEPTIHAGQRVRIVRSTNGVAS
jgi:HlyD family secretion protein